MSGWDSDYRYEADSLFEQTFRCIPFDKYKNPELESGNKIIMPESSLDTLIHLPVKYPLIFKIRSYSADKASHCGVLEFGAEEGCVYMPRWMMQNLNVQEGDDVVLSDAALSKGVYMELRPHETAFVEIADPRAVLETKLREFACLSCGDTIAVRYRGRDFYLDVLELKPGGAAVSLIDTDCVLDFATPLDYVEKKMEKLDCLGQDIKKDDEGGEREEVTAFRPFSGVGRRLDGRSAVVADPAVEAGEKREEKDGGKEEFKPFTGRGRTLGNPFFN